MRRKKMFVQKFLHNPCHVTGVAHALQCEMLFSSSLLESSNLKVLVMTPSIQIDSFLFKGKGTTNVDML